MKNLIRFYRWEAGLKQYELANLLGCSAPYLSRVENCREKVTEEFKRKVAKIFNVNVEDIFPSNGEDQEGASGRQAPGR